MPHVPGCQVFRSFLVVIMVLVAQVASAQTVSISPTVVAPGATVTVTVSGGPGNAQDWVALSPAGASTRTYGSWAYLTTGTQVAPASPPYKTNGSVVLGVASMSGAYEARFFLNNGFTLLASAPFTVTPNNTGMARGTPAPGAPCTSPNKDDSFYDLTSAGSIEIFVCDPVANKFRQASPALPATPR